MSVNSSITEHEHCEKVIYIAQNSHFLMMRKLCEDDLKILCEGRNILSFFSYTLHFFHEYFMYHIISDHISERQFSYI